MMHSQQNVKLIQYVLVVNMSDKSHNGAAGASVIVTDKIIKWNF